MVDEKQQRYFVIVQATNKNDAVAKAAKLRDQFKRTLKHVVGK